MTVPEKTKLIGASAVCIAAVLWGFDGVVLTPRLYNLNTGFVVLLLHLIPFVLMQPVLFREYANLSRIPSGDWITFGLVAFFGGALGTLAIVKALFLVNFQQLTVVVLLQKLQPVFAIILAAILLKEKIRSRFILWAAVAIIASYFLTFGFTLPNLQVGANTTQAAVWAIIAAASFGSATVLGRKILITYDFTTATFYRFGITSIIMLVYLIFSGNLNHFGAITPTNWLIFLIIAFTTGSGAIFLYYFGLKRIRASIATICELCFPASAIIFDYLINDSTLTAVQFASAVVLLLAIIKISQQKRK
ncbi:MAG: EamA family transporter [Candidatus Marinimicrobia bacterium]|nr:EamA family transporter [Candidatus Neomarinimicrobiota bacterium]